MIKESLLRNPKTIWYGPHPCEKCGKTIIRTALEQGGVSLDCDDFNHHYPNFQWGEHACQGMQKTCSHCFGTGMEQDQKSVGSHMRELRLQANKSLKDVAKNMAVSSAYLSDLELGKRSWVADLRDRYLIALK